MKIAITGKMCYGKTTLANIIKEIDNEYIIHSFGTKVKEIATDLFNMKKKDRTLLTSIGTKMRDIDQDIWVKYIIKQCYELDKVIIDDLRYQNEYEYLLKNNYMIIELILPIEIQINRIKKLYPNNYQDHLNNMIHISEKGLIIKDSLKIDMSQDLDIIKNIMLINLK